MTFPVAFSERLRSAFQATPRGVVGLVDGLLDLCREHPLRLRFESDRCLVSSPDADPGEGLAFSLPRSAFRAVLARIAALCGEHTSPYRGEGELRLGHDPDASIHVSFVNTPAEQRLDLTHAGEVGESAGLRAADLASASRAD